MSYPLTQTVIEAARAGGEALVALRDRPRAVTSKGFRDDVTDADYAAQAAIFAAIHAHAPDALIVSEENDFGHAIADWEPPAGLWWMTDPLDGTTNYSRGIPHFCVTVAVLEGLEVVAGAIYDPLRGQMFAAARGGGARLNGQPVHVARQADLAEAVLETGLARAVTTRRKSLAIFNALATECRTVRSSGAAALALAYVAAGWLDAYVHLTLRPWDCAAGVLLIREAGGAVSRPDGGPWTLRDREILASSAPLHDRLAAITQKALDGAGE